MIVSAVWLGLLALATNPQDPVLTPVAAAAREAFRTHAFGALLSDVAWVRLRLPGQRGGPPVRGVVAVAALEAFTRRHQELDVAVVSAAVLSDRQGYVVLRRRYRPVGLGTVETHRVLLGVRVVGGGWSVVEVWMGEGG